MSQIRVEKDRRQAISKQFGPSRTCRPTPRINARHAHPLIPISSLFGRSPLPHFPTFPTFRLPLPHSPLPSPLPTFDPEPIAPAGM